ncbi:hypothetical protein [Cellulomonas sp. NPDC089187]|uniref:hypothetical protein n=1 Tax=Cellulomonas sp. NPDC089187 TaxID=3154970 RepID=UPI003431CA56
MSTDADGMHHVTDRIARPVLSTPSWSVARSALDVPAPARRHPRRRRRSGARPAGR